MLQQFTTSLRAFDDCLFGEENLARHFLAIVSLSDVYKKWETMASEDIKSTMEYKRKPSDRSEVYKKRRKIGYTDHTQDYIVRDVRRTLFETISSFKGNLEDDNEKARLIEDQLLALREAFRVPLESGEDGCQIVAKKLLDLYRTGRLGQYTLDSISCNSQ
ncbi:hypothetical protein GIB67_013584 [Kingdonia uniflora]|uniref:Uncharacterized protein n=1 Tax=Kingdonia uniflora TaxID=39325 RepID=A0A7J7KV28_9MAGN|nr:hypothetical protein GIB67_013584 [Kingdonia uniflora]